MRDWTDDQVENHFTTLVKNERNSTSRVIVCLLEIERRRIHLKRATSDLYDYMTRVHQYSHGGAGRRIQSAKLVRAVPEVLTKLDNGDLSVSTATMLQITLNSEVRRTGKDITNEQKRALVEEISGKTAGEVQKILAGHFPKSVKKNDSIRSINEKECRLTTIISNETAELIKEAKNWVSNEMPNASLDDVINAAFKALAKEKKKKKAKMATREDNPELECEFEDEKTGRRCKTKFRPEHDHIHPKCQGGSDAAENRRWLWAV